LLRLNHTTTKEQQPDFEIKLALKESVKLFIYLLINPMRKIFSIAVLILYTGLTFTYLTILQTTIAQVQLPTTTTTTNVTLLNKTATNDTVPNSNNDTVTNG
jgi:hypothetical protein